MGKRICSVDGCSGSHKGHGFCGKHYQRFKKYGAPEAPSRKVQCSGPQCERLVEIQNSRSSGLCRSHYKQQSLGKPLTVLAVATKDLGRPEVCVYPGCERPHKARGLCKTHNEQAKKGEQLREVQARLAPGPCSVDGCERRRFANGLCTQHNFVRVTRWVRYGITPETALAIYAAQGGACAICDREDSLDRLYVDHDHACCPTILRRFCGECVRGLLCARCNFGLGHFADDPDRLRSAASYVERHST